MTTKNLTPDKALGCMTSLWHMFVTAPMWWAMLFGVLQHMGDDCPLWMWVCFFAYVPCSMASIIAAAATRVIWQQGDNV